MEADAAAEMEIAASTTRKIRKKELTQRSRRGHREHRERTMLGE
jgi:hypothetical protein